MDNHHHKAEGAIVPCLNSIIFATHSDAQDFAEALNLGHASRQGLKVEVVNAESESGPIDPLDLVCVCSHEKYRHSNDGKCTARRCRCEHFSESPTQPSPSTKPSPPPTLAPTSSPAVTDEERQQLNEQSLVLPLPSSPELAHELAHALNALLSFGKRGQLAPKEVGLAGYVAIQRFCKEYQK